MSVNQSLWHVSFKMNNLVQNAVALCGYNSCVLDASECADLLQQRSHIWYSICALQDPSAFLKGQIGKLNVSVLGMKATTFILSVLGSDPNLYRLLVAACGI